MIIVGLISGTSADGIDAAVVLFEGQPPALRWQVLAGILVDVTVAMLAIHAIPSAASGVALMLVFNVGATAMLLPLRYGLAGGALAGAAMIGEYVWAYLGFADSATDRPLADGVSYSFRFKRAWLARWRELSGGVDGLITRFEKT